jgi:oligopeptide transport system substrate-binding protein
VCLFAAILCGCAKRESVASAAGPTLRLSQRNEPATLDPATTTLPDEFGILRALLEGLLIPGENGGEPLPGAAQRFEVSPDGLTYTFHLRREARWSNGEPVTAAHFVAAYRRLLTPATAAPKASAFFSVRNARAFVSGALADFSAVGIRTVDAHTLVITLEQPNPHFPHYVASGPWLPAPAAIVATHGRNWTRPANFAGNGPFTLAEWRPDQRIVVRKNPHWHGAAGVRLGEIQFIRYDSGDSEDRAYRAGQVDATMAVPFTKVQAYARERPAELHRAPMIETRYLSFNTRRPPLDDERVRRALALAIDRQKIADRVLMGGQLAAGRLVPPALRDGDRDRPGSQPAGPGGGARGPAPFAGHGFDPDAARQLLAAAGFSPATFPRLELTFWSGPAVLEAVQAMWRQELGIDISLAQREARVHLNAAATGGYDIAFITAIPDVADAAEMLGDFVTGAPENYPHWSDSVFDDTMAAARTLGDPARRAAALLAAEQRLLERAPITPLYFNTKIWLMSPRVRGWQEDGLWARSYQNVYLDEK